ncbi:MAG TPA: helix-turn-helix transcriptional regulator [Longimicrobiales bacterium]|nr:helix-turn-helix transcriptional regulator [Longimicrobiales bacterium]
MALGELQYLTLLAVARLGSGAFAREVREVLRDVAGRDVSVSTVFVTLTRLEDQGLLHSEPGEPPARGGRATRLFALTEEGWTAVRETRDASRRMWDGLEPA